MFEKARSRLRNRVDRTNIAQKKKKSSKKAMILVDFLSQHGFEKKTASLNMEKDLAGLLFHERGCIV